MKMFVSLRGAFSAFLLTALLCYSAVAFGQANSGTIDGTVTDSTGSIVPGAQITLLNPVGGYTRTTTSDSGGAFHFYNLPFNPYRLTATSPGFAASVMSVQISSSVPTHPAFKLGVATATTTVDVETTPDLLEADPTFHTDIDRAIIDRLPLDSNSSQLSSIVTQLSPGVAADSNGLLHGLGDHNQVSFSIDGQPITDQQSKVFSNQLPADAIQSLEVIDGAPPAEYGDKTSLVVVATTRSGQGVVRPTGMFTASYGSFGTTNLGFNLAYGKQRWGNFLSVSGLQSGRFLDAPEFSVFHDKGNEENFFDRVDFQLSQKDALHTNFEYTRSWFQTPNSFDTQFGFVQSGATPAPTDQRSKIETFLVAPTYTHQISDTAILTVAPYVRKDSYHYFPTGNPLGDLGPIQQESVAQQRSLTNAGVHADVSWVRGHNNIKIGGMYEQTFLRENDQLGIVDPTLNTACLDQFGGSVPGTTNPGACAGLGLNPNPTYSTLLPYDLTAGGGLYAWHGQTDVKQLALYGEDQITAGNWLINAGIRGDVYNGLVIQRVAEPRLGISYKIPRTGTVLRVSYARTQETPFNENLVLSSQGCIDPVLNAIFTPINGGSCVVAPFNPGYRNEFHAGLQQSIGHHFVISGDYITKYTHNAYDFSVLGATPITFPIEWHNSKIPGFAISGTLTEVKGLTARITMSSVAARFFNPQVGGVGATPASQGSTLPFRIDHDEKFNETTHLQYAFPFRKSMYYSFNWKFDSGLVAGSTPCYSTNPNSDCYGNSVNVNTGVPFTTPDGRPAINLSSLTADEEFQAGLACNGVKATPTQAITTGGAPVCAANQLTSSLVTIPSPNTEDPDHNPARIQSRNLFDMEFGDDKITSFANDRYRLGARVTAINVTNKYALYNFLSTFSGTHYVSPRTVTGEVDLRF